MKRGRKLKINFSNRLLYSLIAFGIIAILSVGVYALGAVPNPGHAVSELQKCDSDGQVLKMAGGAWTCGLPTEADPVFTAWKANPTLSNPLVVSNSITATSFIYSSSDRALKTNIQPLQGSLDKVLQLQGVSFNFKSTGEKSIGLIAQDVEKVLPELVSGTEGNKKVAYGNIVAVLIEAVKEQQKQIDELKLQIQELKAK
jgi:hypothetical protein